MKTKLNKLVLKGAVAVALAAPFIANAESSINTGAGSPITASARLDFQITIPKVLFLQVGSGTNMGTNATINQIAFTVPAANVGDSSVISASAGSGDLGNGTVTAKVLGNNGTITFTSTTTGALSNGTDTISYSEINTAVANLTSATALSAPALADAATTTVTLTPAVGSKVISQDAKWTYTYKNTTVAAPGTYGGVNTNNSRVVYTASMP